MAGKQVQEMPPKDPGSGPPYTTPQMATIIGVSMATIRSYAKDSAFMKPNVQYRGKQKYFEFTDEHVKQWKHVLESRRDS